MGFRAGLFVKLSMLFNKLFRRYFCDVLRQSKPPFSLKELTAKYANIFRSATLHVTLLLIPRQALHPLIAQRLYFVFGLCASILDWGSAPPEDYVHERNVKLNVGQ